jgi:hypothetical protein
MQATSSTWERLSACHSGGSWLPQGCRSPEEVTTQTGCGTWSRSKAAAPGIPAPRQAALARLAGSGVEVAVVVAVGIGGEVGEAAGWDQPQEHSTNPRVIAARAHRPVPRILIVVLQILGVGARRPGPIRLCIVPRGSSLGGPGLGLQAGSCQGVKNA